MVQNRIRQSDLPWVVPLGQALDKHYFCTNKTRNHEGCDLSFIKLSHLSFWFRFEHGELVPSLPNLFLMTSQV